MSNVHIAPGGMIVGSIKGRNSAGAPIRDYNRHAIVLLDGWLHHMAQNVGDPALPWYRMHDQSVPGFAEADYPAPLVVNDIYDSNHLRGYDALVVKDKVCRRWRYNQKEWQPVDEWPVFSGVTGAPALTRHEEYLPGFGRVQLHAFLPTDFGLFRMSYSESLGIWLPRDLVTDQQTGWPSVVYIEGETLVYATVGSSLRAFSKYHDTSLFPNWSEVAVRSINVPCNGTPSAVVLWPRLAWKGKYPYHELGQVHVVVPSEKGLMHFWTEQRGPFDWQSVLMSNKAFSGVALVAPVLAITEGSKGWEKVGNIEALLTLNRDTIQQKWEGETRTWNEPAFAF